MKLEDIEIGDIYTSKLKPDLSLLVLEKIKDDEIENSELVECQYFNEKKGRFEQDWFAVHSLKKPFYGNSVENITHV